jgi:hypothetical protein
MGQRFILARYPLEIYSAHRQELYLNEDGERPHKIRPYGTSRKFAYRAIWQHKDRVTDRSAKKSARQQAKRALREE